MLDHISHSQIDMFNRCPRQWAYRYVEGIRTPPSGALIVGGTYHSTLEFNFRSKLQTGKDLRLEDCFDLFSDYWNKRLEDTEEVDWEEKQPGETKDQGMELVEAYMTKVAPDVIPTAVEQVVIRPVVGVDVVSVLDLIDSEDRTVDHKTSARLWNQVRADSHGQPTAYSFTRDKIAPVQFHIAVKPTKTLPARVQILETRRSLKDVLWWVKMVEEIIEQMESGVYPPRPGDWYCSPRFCGYYKRCMEQYSVSIFG